MGKSVGGLILVFILVLISVYVYNSFIAEKGKTIADLGKKTA